VIGRLHHVIVDCPDPAALAAFYSELLGLPVTWQEDDFAVVSASDTTSGIGFQLAPDFQPPGGRTRPGPSRCTSMSWSMTSRPLSHGCWRWAPGGFPVGTATHPSTPTRPGIRSA
jgi:catechol 2,3-dioxygenase-like lactoylglutathione lyase family enzyme